MGIRDAWKGMFMKRNIPSQKNVGTEIGSFGNMIFGGMPLDEYNPDLQFPKSTKVYDQMRRSDSQVNAVLMAMKLPIRATDWYIEVDEDLKDGQGDQADQIKQFIEDNLFGGMVYSWDDHLREALLMLDFGFSVFEKVFRYTNWNGRKVVVLDKYAPRVANSIWRWPQDEVTGTITQVEQINYLTGAVIDIPIDRLRLYTYQREGENPVGISALRPAYMNWYYKNAMLQIVAVGMEKALVGTPYAKMPKGSSKEETDKVLQVLSNIRAAQAAGFTVDSETEIDQLDIKSSFAEAMQLIEYHDTQMARSVLAQFINLGTMSTSSGGAYALAQSMVDMFCMSLEAIANYIEGEVQKDIEALVQWNFGPDAPMVYLKHERISFKDLTQTATALAALASGHIINPDEDLENKVREWFGIGPISQAFLENQQNFPPNRQVADVIPDEPMSPEQVAQAQKRAGMAPAPGQQPTQAADTKGGLKLSDSVLPTGINGETPEPAGTTKWRRDLTTYEKTVNLTDLNDKWSTAEEQMTDRMRAQMQQSSTQLMTQVERIVNTSQTLKQKLDAINALQVNRQAKYAETISTQAQTLYQYGISSVQQETGVDASGVSATSQELNAKSVTLASLQMQKMLSAVQLSVVTDLSKGVDPKRIMFDAKKAASDYIEGPDLKASAMITVGEAINIGRGAAAKAVGVVGAVWSAILDAKTCPLCEELDGKVINADDPDFDVFRPPIHNGCRCFWIYIMKGSTDVEYDWSTPHGAMVKKYGNLVT